MAAPTVADLNSKFKPLIAAQISVVRQAIADGRIATQEAQEALDALQTEYAAKLRVIRAYEDAVAKQAEIAPILEAPPVI